MARVAFDPVGGPTFPKLIPALTDQGVVYIYGALSEGDTTIPMLEMIPKMSAIKGYSILCPALHFIRATLDEREDEKLREVFHDSTPQ